jgi:iron complex transport system permease protein
MRTKRRKLAYWLGSLFALLILSILATIMIGAVKIPMNTVLQILGSQLPFLNIEGNFTSSQFDTIINLRLPRILLAALVGAMLALAGVAYQGILHNPLAEPYILGVSSGAAIGAASSIIFLGGTVIGYFTIPIFALIGALVTLALVIMLARINNQRGTQTLILAGVIMQALNSAILIFLVTISGDAMEKVIFWTMGTLANRDWIDVLVLLPVFLLGSFYLLTQVRELNVMSLGERAATHLGMNVERKKIAILVIASFMAATAVSIVGIIGFVGLIIPHLMRLLTGPNHRVLVPVSILAGAIFMLLTDTLARTIVPARELPIGVLTAFIGAPVFAYFLRKTLRGRS